MAQRKVHTETNQLDKTNHLERTGHIERQKTKIPAEIISIKDATQTIKTFLFRPLPSSIALFHFLPGQWLDVFIPSVPVVGGFSITSTPSQYSSAKTFELAIKYSTHPPAKWFHESARIGDSVEVRVGGDFVWNKKKELEEETESVVLIAGGVGINPLVSMLGTILESDDEDRKNEGKSEIDGHIKKIRLLYSARTFSELLFYDRIEKLRSVWSNVLECKYFLTRDDPPSLPIVNFGTEFYYRQRIDQAILNELVERERANMDRLKCFLCGPPQMEDDLIKYLKEAGMNEERILFEKWW
ncbi:13712_t:CDS:2 [Acaulospora morrowiae]|uniref:Oxidoreductase NAD-binding domain-containing protein 1 n=1 Tax=Acaulospora morrowiae TaxID=94023 RepID=A0A9N8Z1X3_9GLOM|nr:13712_t:CDS:2 [Acaulospora morrowiae]